MPLDIYKRGHSDGLIAAIMLLKDYAAEARADKKHQAANYLTAAATKVSQLKAHHANTQNPKKDHSMAKRKEPPTQEQIDALADKAQNFSFEVREMGENVSVMQQTLKTANAAAKINQLAEACLVMNRMLLSLAQLVEDKVELEHKLRSRAAEMSK